MKRLLQKLTGANLRGWKQWAVHAAVIFAVLGVAGLLVAVSGIMPIKASSGHWAITEWFLQFSKVRSVDTHSKTIEAPPLDDPALIVRGAGHYHMGCFPCHGSPELKYPPIAQAMLPPPPYLGDPTAEWEPEELFYLVKHGIKFTGMPAWPAQHRDDEVWAMVAFLEKFPDLNVEEYRRLARNISQSQDSAALEELAGAKSRPLAVDRCNACHGAKGQGREEGAFPVLAGQKRDYLANSLQAFRDGERHSGTMKPMAAGLTDEDIGQIADYYSAQNPVPSSKTDADGKSSEPEIEQGEQIARKGIPESRVPACIDCHGPTEGERNSNYPHLAGQPASYLALQLELFQNGHRGGTEYAHLMDHVATHLNAEQIQNVAAYYQSLSPSDN